ncbi:MAG: hypothetical protein ACOC7X_02150 [Spirochaetota bacterium]
MHKIALRVALAAIVALVLLLSCEAGTDPGSDGAGGEQIVSFVVESQQYVFTDNLSAGYTPADNTTCVVASDAVGAMAENAFHLYFPGDSAGTFTDPPDSNTDLPRIGILIDSIAYYTWEAGQGCWFLIDVSAYGPVGGRIEGTFSGELIDGAERIQVSDGVFSVIRYN